MRDRFLRKRQEKERKNGNSKIRTGYYRHDYSIS